MIREPVEKFEYDPSAFINVRSIEEAKRVILTPEGESTESRWARETPYFADMILEHIPLGAISKMVDFGCGVGRLSKEIMDRTHCFTWGIDLSRSMRALASWYVQNDRFCALSPEMMSFLPPAEAVLSVWVLQHVAVPTEVAPRLAALLKPNGRLFIVDMHTRAVPRAGGRWFDDGQDIRAIVSSNLREVAYGRLDPKKVAPGAVGPSWWGVFERS